ncbi:MAG TPA: alpha/beta family hydrolase [Acetobacteraceae bacterium]|jgi:predicted alpha/beta-hydrolase family hydrolase|nr:alpha/beta family hydrolase [Acetobacteraceae bacterium]
MDFRALGPDAAAITLLLAHGAGAGMDSRFLADVAAGLAAEGVRTVRFEFPYMQARSAGLRKPPDPAPRLLQCFRDAAAHWQDGRPLALGGKSLGGRMATMLADEIGAAAVVVFGYPFHPPDQPTRLRTAHLAELRTPTLILQGERDPFGTRAEVGGYRLSPAVRIHWLPDGDHSLEPRKASGRTAAANHAEAIAAAAEFLRAHAR